METIGVERVFSAPYVKDHLGCKDVETVYRLIAAGRLRAIRVGRLVRVPESALIEFIAGR